MNLIISNSGDKPIYEQIVSQMKNLIITGELKAGDPVPSIRVLAKELRISVITTKRAYEDLAAEGFLVMVPGKGSFVAGRDESLIREESLRRAEEYLEKAVRIARENGIGEEELAEVLHLLYS